MNELERAPPKRRGAKQSNKNRKEVKKIEKESKKNDIGSFSSCHVMWNHSSQCYGIKSSNNSQCQLVLSWTKRNRIFWF